MKIFLLISLLISLFFGGSGCSVIIANKLDEKESPAMVGVDSGIKRDKGNISSDGRIANNDWRISAGDGTTAGASDGTVVSNSKLKGEFGQSDSFVIGELVLVDLTGVTVNNPSALIYAKDITAGKRVPITTQTNNRHGFFIPPGISEGSVKVRIYNAGAELPQLACSIEIIRLVPVALGNKNTLFLLDSRTLSAVAPPHVFQVPLSNQLFNPEPILISPSGRYLLLNGYLSNNPTYRLFLVDLVLGQTKELALDQTTVTLNGSPLDCAFTPAFMVMPAPDTYAIMPEKELWIAAAPSDVTTPGKNLYRSAISLQNNVFSLTTKLAMQNVRNASTLLEDYSGVPKARIFGANSTSGLWYLDSSGSGPFNNNQTRSYITASSTKRGEAATDYISGIMALYTGTNRWGGLVTYVDIYEWKFPLNSTVEQPRLMQSAIQIQGSNSLAINPERLWPVPGTNVVGFLDSSYDSNYFAYGLLTTSSFETKMDGNNYLTSNLRLLAMPTMNNTRRLLAIHGQTIGVYSALSSESLNYIKLFPEKELQAGIHHPLDQTFFTIGAEGLKKFQYNAGMATSSATTNQYAGANGSSIAIQP